MSREQSGRRGVIKATISHAGVGAGGGYAWSPVATSGGNKNKTAPAQPSFIKISPSVQRWARHFAIPPDLSGIQLPGSESQPHPYKLCDLKQVSSVFSFVKKGLFMVPAFSCHR